MLNLSNNYQLTFRPFLCQGVLEGLKKLRRALKVIKESFYMASSASGQNGAILPARDYPLYPESKISHIINPLFAKFVRPRWLDIGHVRFLRVYDKHAKKKKNLANIQPS